MPMGQLTEAEIAEYEALKAARDEGIRQEEEANMPPTPTHYLHLPDGTVIESAGIMTHYKSIPVVYTAEIPEGA